MHQSSIKSCTISKRTEPSFHLSLLTQESHWVCPKRFVCLWYVSVQTVHLSCTDTNTVSKRTKMIFHKTHFTYEFHRVRPKLFMSLWYVQGKPCTYVASRLALSPNGPNREPLDSCHLWVPSGASKMIYKPMVRLNKPSTNLALSLTLSQNRLKQDSTRCMSPRNSIDNLQYYFEAYDTFDANVHQSCIKSSTISKRTEPSIHLSLVT
jgi:hypothetical protein